MWQLNNLQWLIYYEAESNHTKPNQFFNILIKKILSFYTLDVRVHEK